MTVDRPLGNALEIAALIDHTLLKPEAMESDILLVCRQAVQYKFASVCVNPHWVPLVHSNLAGSAVRTCCVNGFPLGANRTRVKVEEARIAISEGASEIDMVLNLGAVRSNCDVFPELAEMVAVAHQGGAILKVILETCLLSEEQKVRACETAKRAGADFVKTSTGFSTGGATESDVALMRAAVGPGMGVKASGGVRSLDTLTKMVHAGATRIGTSSGVQIIDEFLGSAAGKSGVEASGGY